MSDAQQTLPPESDANAQKLAKLFKWILIVAAAAALIGISKGRFDTFMERRATHEREQRAVAEQEQSKRELEDLQAKLAAEEERRSRAEEELQSRPVAAPNPEPEEASSQDDSVVDASQIPPAPEPRRAVSTGGSSAGGNDYRFPEMSQRVLSEDEVAGMTYAQLRYAVNETYARQGYVFKSADLRSHFAQQAWYSPDSSISMAQAERRMSTTELRNVRLAARYRDLKKP